MIQGNPDVLGFADCANRRIEIRSQNLAGNELEDVAAHEIGHALGLHHVGDEDSADFLTPLMATCLAPGSTARQFSNDDAGAIQKERSNIGGAGSLHANWGFERWSNANTPNYWTFGGSHSRVQVTAGQQFGAAALGWKHLEANASISQWVTVHRQPQTLTARSSIKLQSSGTVTGSVTVFIEYRRRDYGPNPGCNSPWPTGRDQNTVTFLSGGWNFLASGSQTPTASWVSYDFGSAAMPGFGDAIDVRIRIASSVTGTDGLSRQVNFDNTRVWES